MNAQEEVRVYICMCVRTVELAFVSVRMCFVCALCVFSRPVCMCVWYGMNSCHHECLCVFCADTIFLLPQRVQEFSPVVGETVTLDAPVCGREINKFRFVWIYNGKELPSQDLLSYTFQALEPSYCVCLALNPASSKKVYSSRLFVVQPKEAQPAGY